METLRRALQMRGFASLTAYVESQPTVSLAELADRLDSTIATTELEYQLIAEAEADGAMERCARSLLARILHCKLSEDWRRGADTRGTLESTADHLSRAFFTLAMALPSAYHDAIDRIDRGMRSAELPVDWLPEGADDPALVELFACYWAAADGEPLSSDVETATAGRSPDVAS
jgi:hypothetical protein